MGGGGLYTIIQIINVIKRLTKVKLTDVFFVHACL